MKKLFALIVFITVLSINCFAQTGYLSVNSEPTGAKLTVDGAFKGNTPVELLALPTGKHTILVSYKDYEAEGFDVIIKRNELEKRNIVLKKSHDSNITEKKFEQHPRTDLNEVSLQYRDDVIGTGKKAKSGDLVTIRFKAWFVNSTEDNLFKDWSNDVSKTKQLIGSTTENGKPIKFLLKDGNFIMGSREGIAGMKIGGTRTILIPPELAYGKQGFGPVPPNSTIKVVVTLEDTKEPIITSLWQVDPRQYNTTEDGLTFAIIQEGEGTPADSGDVVTVHYSGYLARDSTKFDSSVERDEPLTFKLGSNAVIKGWEEGISLLNKGAKARLIVPPELGYGSKELAIIPSNSTLIFDIEIIDITK